MKIKKSYGNKIIRNSTQEFYLKLRYFISLLELEAASCHGICGATIKYVPKSFSPWDLMAKEKGHSQLVKELFRTMCEVNMEVNPNGRN